MTEATYLADVAARSRLRLATAARRTGVVLERRTSLQQRVRQSPWLSLSLGAAAGVAIGRFAAPVGLLRRTGALGMRVVRVAALRNVLDALEE